MSKTQPIRTVQASGVSKAVTDAVVRQSRQTQSGSWTKIIKTSSPIRRWSAQ